MFGVERGLAYVWGGDAEMGIDAPRADVVETDCME